MRSACEPPHDNFGYKAQRLRSVPLCLQDYSTEVLRLQQSAPQASGPWVLIFAPHEFAWIAPFPEISLGPHFRLEVFSPGFLPSLQAADVSSQMNTVDGSMLVWRKSYACI